MRSAAERAPAVRRRRRLRRRWVRRLALLAVLALAAAVLYRVLPHRYYTAAQLGIPEIRSARDADGDGLEDYADMVRGARDYIATKPRYQSRYYAGGYPDDGLGVCTDVIWQAFRAAGYELKELVDADIAAHREAYPFIETPDGNIDFRRVNTLDVFFSRCAETLTTDLDDPAQWQAGDIVVFGEREHIALCSDRRDKDGVPWIIHHGSLVDGAVERQDMYKHPVTGHYRWPG